MKKVFYFIAACAALLACSKEVVDAPEANNGEQENVVDDSKTVHELFVSLSAIVDDPNLKPSKNT